MALFSSLFGGQAGSQPGRHADAPADPAELGPGEEDAELSAAHLDPDADADEAVDTDADAEIGSIVSSMIDPLDDDFGMIG